MQVRLLHNGIQGRYVPEALVWHYVPPERCSSKWILTRAFRAGVERGLKYRKGGRRIAGIPRWAFRESARELLNVVGGAVRADGRRVFEARYALNRLRGFVRGVRLARRAGEAPAAFDAEQCRRAIAR